MRQFHYELFDNESIEISEISKRPNKNKSENQAVSKVSRHINQFVYELFDNENVEVTTRVCKFPKNFVPVPNPTFKYFWGIDPQNSPII